MKKLVTLALGLAVLSSGAFVRAEDEKAAEGVKIELTDADKAAIEKVRESGGMALQVAQNDNRYDIAFHLADGEIGNDQLKPLAGLKFIHSLNLRGTNVDDKGLETLVGVTSLERLHLEKTKVTDAGLKSLAKLEKLNYLNLYGTAVTNAGVDSLVALKGLKKLYIWETKIDIEGVKKLKAANAELEIVPDPIKQKRLDELEAKR